MLAVLGIAAVLGAVVGQHAQELHLVRIDCLVTGATPAAKV